jgi:hypothetical protein
MRQKFLLGMVAVLVGVLSLTTAVHAVAPGTVAANAALAFDPFQPNSTTSATTPPTGTIYVPPGGIVVVPPTIPVPRTPGDPPTVYINVSDAPTVIQSATANGTAIFTVTISSPINTTVTVDFTTADGPAGPGGAVAGADYVALSGTITFPANATVAYVSVDVLPGMNNMLKTFYLNLNNPQGVGVTTAVVQLGRAQGIGTIQPSVIDMNIGNSPTVIQSTTATTFATFPVTLSSPATTAVTVNFATSDGTAIQNLDYIAKTGTVTFSPGSISQTITVSVLPENKVANETFYCTISSPGGAPGVVIQNAIGSAEIRGQNSEIFVTGATAPNPVTGTSNIYALVSLDKASTKTITVKLNTADGTAKANVDYKTVSTTVTFSPGQTTHTVAIPLIGISATIPDRVFTVNLSSATGNGFIEDATATMTITGHTGVPPPPTFAINNVTVTAGSAITHAVFTVTRSGDLTKTSTVKFATANSSASSPGDYTAQSGTLSFAVNQSTATISVAVAAQTTHHSTKVFDVNLTTPVGATISDNQGVGTIVSGIAVPPTLAVNNVTVTAGSAVTHAVFTVTRSGDLTKTSSVKFATANSSAVSPGDYTAQSGTLDFAINQSTTTISVDVAAQISHQSTKTFDVNLTSPVSATISDSQGIGTIDSGIAGLSINSVSITAPKTSTSNLVFTVTRTGNTTGTSTVKYATANNTAIAGKDYIVTSGTLTFAAGVTTETMTVKIDAQTMYELSKNFKVNLSSATNSSITTGTGTGTINTPYSLPELSISGFTASQGSSGTTKPFTFEMTLNVGSSQTITVAYATSDGTAKAPANYTAISGTTTFSPGQTIKSMTVNVKGGSLTQSSQIFYVKLSNPVNSKIAVGTGTGTITK